jgi:mono/diheme cytochrome c family protein
MRRALPLAIVLAAVGLFAAGCQDGSKPGGSIAAPLPSTVIGKVAVQAGPTVPAAFKHGDPTAGKQVFLSAGCTGCHTLKDAGATGTVGPNLDQLKPPLARIKLQVENGGGPMPAFKNTLSPKQIDDVSAYVASVAGK